MSLESLARKLGILQPGQHLYFDTTPLTPRMKESASMLVYLARPIDQAANHGTVGWFEDMGAPKLVDRLIEMRIARFNPGAAYGDGQTAFSTVNAINSAAQLAASATIAIVPPGVASLGVPVEIERSLNNNKPTVIFTTEELADGSAQIGDWVGRGARIWTAETMEQESDFELRQALGHRPLPLRRVNSEEDRSIELARRVRQVGLVGDPRARFATHAEISRHPDLPVQFTEEGGVLPSRAHDTDAGLDLATNADCRVEPGEYALLPTGVRAQLPSGWWGLIIGRSSTWTKWGLDVRLGVIDAGYTGELKFGVVNRMELPVEVPKGTRLGQYVLMPAWSGKVVEGGAFEAHPRGDSGWGSSGH